MAVAAAARGCQNHSALASSGMWAMWGQGTDPQTHWLGRWPHYIRKLGIQHRLGLIAWEGMVSYQPTCSGGKLDSEHPEVPLAQSLLRYALLQHSLAGWKGQHSGRPPPHHLPKGQKPAHSEQPLFSAESQRRPSRQRVFSGWPVGQGPRESRACPTRGKVMKKGPEDCPHPETSQTSL